MKKFCKSKLFPISVIIVTTVIWAVFLVFDVLDIPSKIGINISHINFNVWVVLATLTSGILTFLGVLWTIRNEKREHEEDRKRVATERFEDRRNLELERMADRAQIEKDRKDEEKRRAKPYLAVAGKRTDTGFKYQLTFKTNESNSNHRGRITVLNNVVCILKELVIESSHLKSIDKHAIVFSNENIVDIYSSITPNNNCFLICEDIYGNKYRYDLIFTENSSTGMIAYIGLPIDYNE